jgi:hypothetical protein
MDNSDVLNKIGQYYTARLKENLRSDGNYATGKLDRAIGYRVDGNTLVVTATGSAAVLLSLSSGRKQSNKLPSREMVTRVVDWMKAKGMRPLSRNKKGRFLKQTESTFRKSAYALGRSMLRRGYKGSQVISRSYRELEKNIDADILAAFRKGLEDNLNNITVK